LVLLYVTCSLNKNYLSPYNRDVVYTPQLEKFASRGLVFERHQTSCGQSGPAYASIYSGGDPILHGIYAHPKKLSESVYLITEAYSDNGWDTFSWLRHFNANSRLNYAQGVPNDRQQSDFLRAEDPIFKQVLEQLRTDQKKRVFITTNFTVTHAPYNPEESLYCSGEIEGVTGASAGAWGFCSRYPEQCQGLNEEGLSLYRKLFLGGEYMNFCAYYDQTVSRLHLTESATAELIKANDIIYKYNVSKLDALFGEVIKEIESYGLLNESLIVFTSDHGEYLYEDYLSRKWSHGFLLTPQDLEPPLIIALPAGAVNVGHVKNLTRHIDLFPTLAALSGISIPERYKEKIMGVDLSGAILGTKTMPSLAAHSHTALPSYIEKPHEEKIARDPYKISTAIRTGDMIYKMFSGNQFKPSMDRLFEVYNWTKDPQERNNLYKSSDKRCREMHRLLEEYLQQLADAYEIWESADLTKEEDFSPEEEKEMEKQIEQLESLGYI